MKNKFYTFNLVQLLVFVAIGLYIIFRPVDYTGAIQTWSLAVFSLLLWVGFYFLMLAAEWSVYILVQMYKNGPKRN